VRKTRLMSWIFLLFSLAFFLIPDFRTALEVPLASMAPQLSFIPIWPKTAGAKLLSLSRFVSPQELLRLGQEADRRGDSQLMAFAALYLPAQERRDDILRLTDRAVAANPQMTWLYRDLAYRYKDEWESPAFGPTLRARIDKLLAYDAGNAVPYLMQAELIRSSRGEAWPAGPLALAQHLDALAKEVEWQKAMQAAYAQPRYDEYAVRRFELDREVLLQRGWKNPLVMTFLVAQYPVPDLLNIREYASLLVDKFGASAEAAGHREEALRYYGQAAQFGERMRLQGHYGLEDSLAMTIQTIAYERLAPALKKAHRESEAARVEAALQQLRQDAERLRKDPFTETSNYGWSVLLVNLYAFLVWVFAFVVLCCLLYVNAKLWIRKEKKGRLFHTITVAENYAPIFLFLSSLALYLAYAPFSQNFSHYMTTDGPFYKIDLMLFNSFPNWLAWFGPALPLHNPFRAYLTYVGAGLLLILILAGIVWWRETPKAPARSQEKAV